MPKPTLRHGAMVLLPHLIQPLNYIGCAVVLAIFIFPFTNELTLETILTTFSCNILKSLPNTVSFPTEGGLSCAARRCTALMEARENPSLEIRRIDVDQLLSASEFASQFESRNVPAVFNGCVKDWKAFSKWNPYAGGLDYLEEKVGLCIVEAMLSRAAPVFYGDLRSHERVPSPFSTFIGYCKQHMERKYADQGCSDEFKNKDLEGSSIEQNYTDRGYAPQQLYLAQVSIFNSENKGQAQLEILSEDIQKPAMLGNVSLAAINLWMNNAGARSSTHYDPHHNLLCIVSGCKRGEIV